MAKASFSDSPRDKLDELREEYQGYLKNDTSTRLANNVSQKAWHLIDWVFKETGRPENEKGDFREKLYPKCPALLTLHDIANEEKHGELTNPKASIKDAKTHIGAFDRSFSDDFDKTRKVIVYEDGREVNFSRIIKEAVEFWEDYFRSMT